MNPKNIFQKCRGVGLFGLGVTLVLGIGVLRTWGQTPTSQWQSGISRGLDVSRPPGVSSSALNLAPTQSDNSIAESPRTSHDHALQLVRRVIERLALGDAFDAKVRQRVWVGGREVIGVGTYEQAGDGSGRFNLQVAMHDGDGKHTLQQISDGRLAWTREQIGDEITLNRVDVGRLDQWVHGSSLSYSTPNTDRRQAIGPQERLRPSIADDLPPSVRVGGFTEMLERLSTDYDLRVVAGRLEEQEVWILRGSLRSDVRKKMLADFPNNQWPELCPTEAVVAIAKSNNPETQFGQGLPIRFEFWASPTSVVESADQPAEPKVQANLVSRKTPEKVAENATTRPATNRLVSLIELYSIRPIASPPIGRFRFDNQDMEVNFTNGTDRYLSRYGIRITERQSRMLRR